MRIQPDALSVTLDGYHMSEYLLHSAGCVGAGQGITLGDHSRHPAIFSNYLHHAVGDQVAASRLAKDHVATPEGRDARRPHFKDIAILDKRLHTYATGAKAQATSSIENFDGQCREVGLA